MNNENMEVWPVKPIQMNIWSIKVSPKEKA